MSGNNVVPMPKPASGEAPSQQAWPMNPIYPVPPGPWSGAPGCAPPCPPNSLMQCYCDIQNSMQFISAIMIDLINNNPAVAEAMIAAIEKSGSSLPLIGVTDGSNAQPGQVGEFLTMAIGPSTGQIATGTQTQTFSLGVLPPGDWVAWAWFFPTIFLTTVTYQLFHVPQASNPMLGNVWYTGPGPGEGLVVPTSPARISVAAPTLISFQMTTTNAGAAGGFTFQFEARRSR